MIIKIKNKYFFAILGSFGGSHQFKGHHLQRIISQWQMRGLREGNFSIFWDPHSEYILGLRGRFY